MYILINMTHIHSSLKPPLSGNFPDVCKLDFLCCGGGGPRFFKKGPVVDLDSGQGLSQGRGGLSLMDADLFWLQGAACPATQGMFVWGGSFSLHASLTPHRLMWQCSQISFFWEYFLSLKQKPKLYPCGIS